MGGQGVGDGVDVGVGGTRGTGVLLGVGVNVPVAGGVAELAGTHSIWPAQMVLQSGSPLATHKAAGLTP
jgi:hypothetical protein